LFIVMAVIAGASLLGMAGAWRGVMESFAIAGAAAGTSDTSHINIVGSNYPLFVADTMRVLLFLLALFALSMANVRARLRPELWGLAVGSLVLLELWSVERRYLQFTPRASELFAADEVVKALQADTTLYRVMFVPIQGFRNVYWQNNYFIVHDIRMSMGYNGQELHRYDELLGGKNVFANLGSPATWAVSGVKYILCDTTGLPGLEPVGGPLRTYEGTTTHLFRNPNALPYAFLVPRAFRVDAPDEQVASTLASDRFDPRGLLLLPKDAPVGEDSALAFGAHIDTPVSIHEVRPGMLHAELAAPATSNAFLYVAENYYPDWHAKVDGRDAPVVRAQLTFMAVPVAAGARVGDLEFIPQNYAVGRTITLVSVLGVLVLALTGVFLGRRKPETVAAAA
jgi:hypothetical protein